MSNTAKLAIILHMGAVSSKIVKVLKNIVLLPYLETSDIHILPSLASISILHNLKLPTKTEISPILGVYAQDKQINSIEVIIPSCFFFWLRTTLLLTDKLSMFIPHPICTLQAKSPKITLSPERAQMPVNCPLIYL